MQDANQFNNPLISSLQTSQLDSINLKKMSLCENFYSLMMEHRYLPNLVELSASVAAQKLVFQLKSSYGSLIFYQTTFRQEGQHLICYKHDQWAVKSSDVLLGSIEGSPFFSSHQQFQRVKHNHLFLDIAPGGRVRSLESGLGVNFVIHLKDLEKIEHE